MHLNAIQRTAVSQFMTPATEIRHFSAGKNHALLTVPKYSDSPDLSIKVQQKKP